MILKDPRYNIVRAPIFFMGLAYVGGRNLITLGELFMMWQNEDDLVFTCTCGGKSVCFKFGGSPLSGTEWISQTICLTCFAIDRKGGLRSPLHAKIAVVRKYKPIQPIAEKSVSYKELINLCVE